MCSIRHAALGMTGSADGLAPNGDRTSADAGMAKYFALMGGLILEIIENICGLLLYVSKSRNVNIKKCYC